LKKLAGTTSLELATYAMQVPKINSMLSDAYASKNV